MERLKSMKDTLVSCIQGQMTHLDSVDTKELGEVVDMVKDLEEAIYYCTITKSMEKAEKEEEHYKSQPKYFREYLYPYPEYPYERDMDRGHGKMYYGGDRSGNGSNMNGNGTSGANGSGGGRYYTEREYPVEVRDPREGKSHWSRKTYMESKEMHHDKTKQMKELEKYMQELTSDILEMIDEASAEEKQYLSTKISTLASKISAK